MYIISPLDFKENLPLKGVGGLFGRNLFGRIFGRNSTKSYLNMERIDLFVKILGFVTILSESTRKEEFQSLEVREASSSHIKN